MYEHTTNNGKMKTKEFNNILEEISKISIKINNKSETTAEKMVISTTFIATLLEEIKLSKYEKVRILTGLSQKYLDGEI